MPAAQVRRIADEQAAELIRGFNLARLSPAFLNDPYPTYAALREHAPIHRLPDGSFFLTRYDDVAQVYRDTAAWSLIAETDVKLLNAPRTLLVTATNTIALICFIAAGAIHWPETLALGLGAAIGGTLGAMVGKWLPSAAVRLTTLALAVFITTAFFVRAYG